MLRRQESSLSSSRRQAAAAATPPPEIHHAKAIGCMSGIFQLFSKYQNPNKRLTFGRKQEKRKPPSSPPCKTKGSLPPSKNPPPSSAKQEKTEKQCDIKMPRSPTIPPEIRRSDAATPPRNSRTPSSSLVAKLMGLEDIGGCAAAKRPALEEDRTTTEKRQRLLQALEKCNDDLEALKRIIKAVQTTDVRLQPPQHTAAVKKTVQYCSGGDGDSVVVKPCIEKCTEAVAEEEQNIPVDTVEELTRSPISGFSATVQNTNTGATARVTQQRKPTSAKKPGEDDEPIAKLLNNSTTATESSLYTRRRAASAAATPPWCSRAMVQSVEEVCGDISWGEKREIGRIGLVLQDYICRELIEDFVKEMKSSHWSVRPLPLEPCKRKLCF